MADEPRSNEPRAEAGSAVNQGQPPSDERVERVEDRVSEGRYAGWPLESADDTDPLYYLRVLHKRRWTAVTAFLVIVLAGTVYSFRAVPVYEARVRVLVETERRNLVNIQDVVTDLRSAEADQAILQSRWLAKKTLESLNMLPVPQSSGATPAEEAEESFLLSSLWPRLTSAVSWVRGTFASWVPPAPEVPLRDEQVREAQQIDGFLGGLSVMPPTSGVLEIRYRSPDPVRAATFANAHARQYSEQNLELRFAAIKEVTDWLAARLDEQRRKIDASEGALQRFREENRFVTWDGLENPVLTKLNELTTALTRAKTLRLEKEALYDQLEALRTDSSTLLRLPVMLADPMVQQLRVELEGLKRQRAQLSEQLQERHPEMIRLGEAIQTAEAKLQVETDRLIESVRVDAGAALATEASLQEALDAQKLEAVEQNRKNVEVAILEREAASNRQIYDMLVQRARETSIAREINPTYIRVLDPAEVPRAPVSPNRRRDLMLSVLAGLGFAVALVFGFEHLDDRIKLPNQIKSQLGLPFLGLVPEARGKGPSGIVAPLMTNGVPPQFVEAVRSLRTNVMFSFAGEGVKALVTTSAGLGEGKTIVASNLAIALAQAGQRVLLLDADMRRPTLHTLFDRPREPGLSNLLVGSAKAGDVVRSAAVRNLWILPAGHKAPNPPELLGSARFKRFLEGLTGHFDWVVIDAPPAVPVTDACVMAHVVPGVMFVVGSEMTSRKTARRALEQLEAVEARIIGGILSRVDLERNHYYYSGYYHRKYGEYYAPSSRS